MDCLLRYFRPVPRSGSDEFTPISRLQTTRARADSDWYGCAAGRFRRQCANGARKTKRGFHVRRKLVILSMAVLLPMGFIATIGTGVAAAKSSTTFDGNISCNLAGTVTVKPAINLTTPVTVPVTITAKLKNNDCIGLDGTSTTQNGETIKSSTEDLTFTTPPSSPPQPGCAALIGGGPPTTIPSSTIKWKGTSAITSTVLGGSSAVITAGSPNSTIAITGTVTSGWSTPPTATYQITLAVDTATLTKDCESKGGLKKFSVTDNGGDNLEIGPNF